MSTTKINKSKLFKIKKTSDFAHNDRVLSVNMSSEIKNGCI